MRLYADSRRVTHTLYYKHIVWHTDRETRPLTIFGYSAV